jgi:hypothetical protein
MLSNSDSSGVVKKQRATQFNCIGMKKKKKNFEF